MTNLDDQTEILTCTYIDDCHTKIGSTTFHIRQFAEIQENYGIRYMPCEPKPEDMVDTYEIYRAVIGNAGGGVRSFEEAKKTLRAKNYSRVYAGMYAKGNSLEHLVEKHSRYDPSSYLVRPVSVGNVVVLTRGGKKTAYYADVDGFHEAPDFLMQPQKVRNRRKDRGESR